MNRYTKTKNGVTAVIYGNQRNNSRGRGDILPSYTLKELRAWAYSQAIFHVLYDDWKASGFDRDLKPSFDRLDDYKPYTLGNLRIVTWAVNNRRYKDDKINGINTKECSAVAQKTKNGELVSEHYSIRQAERETGVSNAHISAVCLGKRPFAGGFIWEHILTDN